MLIAALVPGCAALRPDVALEPLPARSVCEVARNRDPEGLSDITHVEGDRYWCVNDRGGLLHELEIILDATGKVTSCRALRKVKLAGRVDLEGCARDPLDGRIWVSDESDTSVRQFDPTTGVQTAVAEIPDVYRKNVIANRSLEALAIAPDGLSMYVANEDALTCDGPVADRNHGGVVRIQEFKRKKASDPWKTARYFRYRTGKVLGDPYRNLQISGVVSLIATEDGRLLVLEREMSQKNPLFPSFLAGLYEVCPEGLDGMELAKRPLWIDGTLFSNYEGMCFGPTLSDGSRTVIMVSDGGGPAYESVRVLALRPTEPAP